MIPFNVPPCVGNEEKYIAQAIANHKLCGDGEFTKKCNAKLEQMTGTAKALLTTSCTHATEMAAILSKIQPGDEVIMPRIHLYLRQMLLYCVVQRLFLLIFVRIR